MLEKSDKAPQFDDYDWSDWIAYWGITLEQAKSNWDKAKEEEHPKYIAANQTIHEQAEQKRQEFASQAAARANWEAKKLEIQKQKSEKLQAETKALFSVQKKIPKDISADKRAVYTQKIMFKEQEIDDLGQLERNFENRNEQFLSTTNRYFYESEELSRQRSQFPSQQSRFQESVMQEAYGQAKWTANRQQETFQDSSRVARIEIEN